jgi:hypothetical protein
LITDLRSEKCELRRKKTSPHHGSISNFAEVATNLYLQSRNPSRSSKAKWRSQNLKIKAKPP